MQTVNISLRTLYRPAANSLPKIYSDLGLDYEERVLPSIINEVLKAVVVSALTILNIILIYENDFFILLTRRNSMPVN